MSVNDFSNCIGCGACIYSCPKKCITLKADKNGFLRARADIEQCIECGKCEIKCPQVSKVNKTSSKYYIGYNKSAEERSRSSSGGIFPVLANYILKNGGIVYGAVFSNDYTQVYHERIASLNDIKKTYCSKYIQSNIDSCLPEVKNDLENGLSVLFSGTPCQIAGLKNYLSKDYRQLLCVDIICGGVPSPLVWSKYINEIAKGSSVKNFTFRDKSVSWKMYSLKYELCSGETYKCLHDLDPFFRLFMAGYTICDSCFNCRFRNGYYQSDLTIGDAWGLSSTSDDDNGTSVIISHSEMGERIISQTRNMICLIDTSSGKNQHSLHSPPIKPKDYELFFKGFGNKTVHEYAKIFVPISLKNKINLRCLYFAMAFLKKTGSYKILKMIRAK